MFVRWFLLQTQVGEQLLISLERKTRLEVVQADWLAAQRSGESFADRGS